MGRSVVILVIVGMLAAAGGARADEPSGGPAPAEYEPGAALDLGEFWLGVECYPAPPPLVEQLGLADQGGLVVEQVVPESPAAEAGLKRHDVIVRAGEKVVSGIPDLVAAVNQAGEEALQLEVIRRGKRKEITAIPARRAPGDQPRVWGELPRDEDLDRIWQWFGRLGPDEAWRRPFRLHFFHPGAILPPGAGLHPPLPDNLSVTISKTGKEPTEVVVTRDDQVWELTEHDLEELPADVRPHVERMLGRFPVSGAAGLRAVPRRPGPSAESELQPEPFDSEDQAAPEAERMRRNMERQLEEMEQRMKEMRRSLGRWRESQESMPRIPKRSPREQPKREPVQPDGI